MTRKRPLTLPMVRALSRLLDIPTDILVQEYPTRSAA
jgi:antitoxin component HigA of HigAB toxin-antitoxin module